MKPTHIFAEYVEPKAQERPFVVIRLITSYWQNARGLHMKRSIQFLRKESTGFNFVEEDARSIGAEEIVPRMNLDRYKDGKYYMIPINEHRDYETGTIEDYNYALIPYEERTT